MDWGVIQLARRYARKDCGGSDQAAELPAIGERTFWIGNIQKPTDFTMSPDGSFQFTSPVTTASPVNNRVPGRLYRVEGDWAAHPTVLLLHGWNAELCYRRMFPELAKKLNVLGLNAAVFELPYHMQRRPRGGPVDDFISSDVWSMLEATRQAVGDAQTFCRWLEAEGSRSVGLWGFSLGAWLAGLMVCVEPHLRCAVLTTPIVSVERAIAELPFCEPIRRGLGGRRAELGRLNLWSQNPCVAPRNLLLMEACHDLFAPADTVEQLWRAWGTPEIWRLAHGHISVLFSKNIMDRTIRWLGERLSAG
jgi:pimeloyl-ACP methyl ester carboxylesterase